MFQFHSHVTFINLLTKQTTKDYHTGTILVLLSRIHQNPSITKIMRMWYNPNNYSGAFLAYYAAFIIYKCNVCFFLSFYLSKRTCTKIYCCHPFSKAHAISEVVIMNYKPGLTAGKAKFLIACTQDE